MTSQPIRPLLNDVLHNETRLSVDNQGDASTATNARTFTVREILNKVKTVDNKITVVQA